MVPLNGNSNNSKSKGNEQLDEQTKTPVTSNVKVRKESELKKLKNQFFSEDAGSVKGHIFSNVIVPGIQKLVTDIVKNGIDWIIYGFKGSSNRSTRSGQISYFSYSDRSRVGYDSSRESTFSKNTIYSVNEVIFPDRGEAEEVLLRMRECIQRYGMVAVSDFYEFISVKGNYTDKNYGWRDLTSAEVVRDRDGYSIRFPKITTLD